jgi:hypothetical protein
MNVKGHSEGEEVNLLSHFLNYANAVYPFFLRHTHCDDKNINFSLTMVDSSERKCREN